MDYIGIKVPHTAPIAKCVAVLRRFLPVQFAEIKRRIEKGEYLYLGSFVDSEQVDLALCIYKALNSAGIEVECYEHTDYFAKDRLFSCEQLVDWSRTCHDIEAE